MTKSAELSALPIFYFKNISQKNIVNDKLTQWHFFYDGPIVSFYYIYRQF